MKQKKSRLSLRLGKVWLFAMFLFASSLMSETANAQRCDLVVNGSFAQQVGCPQATFTSDYQCRAAAPIGGAGYAIVTNAAQWNGPWYGLDEFPGSNFLIVDGGLGANGRTRIWIQDVEVVAGRTYTFYVSAKNIVNPFSRAGQDRENPTISLNVNGTTIVTSEPLVQAQTSSEWVHVSGTYTATSSGTVSIDVTQNLKNGYNDVGIDNIRFEYNKPTPTVTSSNVCTGKSVTLTASGALNGEVYEWYTSSTRQDLVFTGNPFVTPALDGTTLYWLTIKSPGTCSLNRIPVYANLSSASTPGPVADQTICQGKSVVLTGNGATAGDVYEWYTSETAVSPIFASANPVTTVLLQSDVTYWLGIRNAAGCKSGRVSAKIIVNPTPAVPTTTEFLTTCTGNQLVLSASGAGNDEVYDWYSTPNGSSLVFTGSTFSTPILYSSIAYYVSVRNTYGCSSARKKVTITVNPTPAPASTASSVSVCGSGSVTLTATATGTINWYDSQTNSASLFTGNTFTTPVLTNTTTYWVSTTSAALCESARTQVKVNINPTAVAPVVADVVLCGVASTTLVATSGGPVLTWYDVASGGHILAYGANFTTPVLSANKSYWVSASTAQGCTSARVQVNVTVNAKPEAPVTTNATRCGCGTVALTASGSSGQFNWYSTPNGGPVVFTGTSFTPYSCSTKNYHVAAVTAAGCESSRVISTINITSTEQEVNLVTNGDFSAPNACPQSGFTSDYQCLATAPVPSTGFNYIAVTNNPAPWNRNYWWGADHSSSPSNFLIADGTGGRVWMQTVNVVAGQKYNFSIWARNIVNPNSGLSPDNNPPVVSIRVNNTVIASSSPLQQAAPNVWTSISGVYTAITTGPVNLNVFQTTAYSYNDIGIDDITFIKVGPTASVQDVTVCGPTSAVLTASGATGSTTYSWYTDATGGTKLFTGKPFATPVLTQNTTYFVALHEAAGCQSKRVPVVVTVNLKPVISATTNANRCDCGTLTLTANGDEGTYNWYTTATSNTVVGTGKTFITPSICTTTEYYVAITSAAGCVSERVRAEASINCAAMLQFDAWDDKVTIPHNDAYNVGAGDFTIEAMINVPAGTLGRRPILSKRTSGSDGVLLYCSSDRLLLQMSGVPNYQSGFYSNIFDGRCHHVAVTRSGTLISFYVDGVFVGGNFAARSLNSSGPLYIGHDAVDRSHWNGAINEVRFWNVARTQNELVTNVNVLSTNPNGLIGLWNFNETGQVVLDGSAIANHAVLGTNNSVEDADPTRTLIACTSANRESDSQQEVEYSESTALNLTAAPNPFTGQTTISVKGLSSADATYYVEIYNMQGSMALSKEVSGSEGLLLGDELSAGMYLVKVIENGMTQTIKIIKE